MNNYKEINIPIDENLCVICLIETQTTFKELFDNYGTICDCNYPIHNDCLIEYLDTNSNNKCIICKKPINITHLINYPIPNLILIPISNLNSIQTQNNVIFFRDIAIYLNFFCIIIANFCIISTTFFVIITVNKIFWRCSGSYNIIKCIENIK